MGASPQIEDQAKTSTDKGEDTEGDESDEEHKEKPSEPTPELVQFPPPPPPPKPHTPNVHLHIATKERSLSLAPLRSASRLL